MIVNGLNLLKLFLPAVLTSSELYAKCASGKNCKDQNLISMFEILWDIFLYILQLEKTNFVCRVLSLNYLLVYVVHSMGYFPVYARSSLSILFNPLSVPLSSKIPSIKKRNGVRTPNGYLPFLSVNQPTEYYLFLQD